MKILVLILSLLVLKNKADEDFEGFFKLVLEHNINESVNSVFTRRGTISIDPLKAGKAIIHDEVFLNENDFETLKELAANDGLYRIRVAKINDDGTHSNYVYGFTKACSLLESGLRDVLTVHLDGEGALIGTFISTNLKYCEGKIWQEKSPNTFQSTVDVKITVPGPMPDTESYVRKLELEKQQALGQNTDNRSFLAKYWMYIVPFIILFLIIGNHDPTTQQR